MRAGMIRAQSECALDIGIGQPHQLGLVWELLTARKQNDPRSALLCQQHVSSERRTACFTFHEL